jgi:competence ComEA-like helix-hairpin-helix protein
MQACKSIVSFICKLSIKLLPLVICGFLLVCCQLKDTKQISPTQSQITISESAIDINSASVQELEKLPHVGAKIAQRIVEHREKYGKFRRPEDLLLIDGISDERFREIRNYIKVE